MTKRSYRMDISVQANIPQTDTNGRVMNTTIANVAGTPLQATC